VVIQRLPAFGQDSIFKKETRMKSVLNSVLIAALLALNANAQTNKTATATQANEAPKLDKEKVSYAIGFYFGNMVKRQGTDVDTDTVAKGIKDVLAGTATITEQEAQQTLQQMQVEARAKKMAEMKAESEKNKAEGEKFLSENA
jgi:hypothetical protein